jgi:hypothetical protein
MTTMPTRQQIEDAPALTFEGRQERQGNIQITAGPAGLVVTFEYTGSLSSIPAAIERLRSAGILELVAGSVPPVAAPAVPRKAQERVEPVFLPDGTPCCPTHQGRELKEGKWGLFCSAKDREGAYCALKFKS